ncbi:TLC domain-containing protein [Mycena maculata]|uniref:TLC domain-containing protein n=1 Tax=Mycena maculata TaxID=230809 RepID=A0AAD7K6Q9_9AGAR|nr:TLC domain-containing protein [Mycena maculata]
MSKEGRLERFGEQGYAVCYFAVVGVWGVYTLSQTRVLTSPFSPSSPSLLSSLKQIFAIRGDHFLKTEFFWRDYPHSHLTGAMKRYYLSQVAYWLQQFLVLILALEKRRSDHWELVVHHCVTVWMVSWSYLMNVTLLGNAVFVCMDVPDMLLAFSKTLNYLNYERGKVVSLAVFFVVWTYFRHYISLRILHSLQAEFRLVPAHAQVFAPRKGLYMAPWMRDQMFYSLCVLQALNVFWYWLIVRIIVRSIVSAQTEDTRSEDDEADADAGAGAALALGGEKGLGASIGRVRLRLRSIYSVCSVCSWAFAPAFPSRSLPPLPVPSFPWLSFPRIPLPAPSVRERTARGDPRTAADTIPF